MRYVLTQPPDRVTYRNLNPADAELQKIQDMGIFLGFLKTKIPVAELIDRSFFPARINAAKIDLSRMDEVIKTKEVSATEDKPE